MGQLPIEVMAMILKWVVSSELDTVSLDNISLVCRGFYLCARDEELWRLICQRSVFQRFPHKCDGAYVLGVSHVLSGGTMSNG